MTGNAPSQACLRAIRAVINAGSYTAAARELDITHAAIAQQIRGFEAKNGIKLFEKEWGRLQPTPLCIDIAEAAERMHEAEMDVERLISRRNISGQFHLRVGLGNAMPGIAIIHHVIKMHPKVSVTVESGSHQEILGSVLKRQVDVGILPDILPDTRFRRQTIIQQEVVAIVSECNPLAKHDCVSLTALIQEPLIFRSRGSSTQKVIDRAFGRIGLTPEPRLIADTRDAVYEAVSLGVGVGFMWRHGTHRTDAVRRLAINEITSSSEEVIFALGNERNPLVDLFFLAGENYMKNIQKAD